MADNARALRQTIRIVARFRAAMVPISGTWGRGDYNADGRADVLWRNRATGSNVVWRSGNPNTANNLRGLGDQNWQAIGSADFNGDHADDVVWRHAVTGQTVIWRTATPPPLSASVRLRAIAWSARAISTATDPTICCGATRATASTSTGAARTPHSANR